MVKGTKIVNITKSRKSEERQSSRSGNSKFSNSNKVIKNQAKGHPICSSNQPGHIKNKHSNQSDDTNIKLRSNIIVNQTKIGHKRVKSDSVNVEHRKILFHNHGASKPFEQNIIQNK